MIVASVSGTIWVGIDVSKRHLDAAIWKGGKKHHWKKAANDDQGFSALVKWARGLADEGSELRFCMESTGDYGVALALHLSECGLYVSVVNPARIKFHALGEGRLTKTDKADAKLIAEFAAERSPEPWPMQDPQRRKLFRLYRRRAQLKEMIGAERARRECPLAIGPECMASIKTVLKALRQELREIEKQLRSLIQSDPILKQQSDLILTLKPLAWGSVFAILAEMPPVERCASAASYAASAGIQSTSKKSGERQTESAPMSRCGKRTVRRALYMTTFVAIRVVPELQALYERLIQRGRKHRQALIACMRKLLMIVYGVLKSGKPYEPRVVIPEPKTTAA